jgi:hypothetical protein
MEFEPGQRERLTFRHKNSSTNINTGVWGIKAILTNTGMMTSLTYLGKITRAFGAVR